MTSKKENRAKRSSWKFDAVGGYKWFLSSVHKALADSRPQGMSWKQFKTTPAYKKRHNVA